jgi:DNA-binding NarL/FixJ family response regulator
MKKQGVASGNINLDRLNEFKVVGYCRIGNDRYPIVEVENSLEDLVDPIKSSVAHESRNQLLHFELNGQTLAIIEAVYSSNPNSDVASFLTKRESQIATFVARGNSNKQIAIQLSISEWTVSTHLRRIFVKLGVDSRAAMVYRCADLLHQF